MSAFYSPAFDTITTKRFKSGESCINKSLCVGNQVHHSQEWRENPSSVQWMHYMGLIQYPNYCVLRKLIFSFFWWRGSTNSNTELHIIIMLRITHTHTYTHTRAGTHTHLCEIDFYLTSQLNIEKRLQLPSLSSVTVWTFIMIARFWKAFLYMCQGQAVY